MDEPFTGNRQAVAFACLLGLCLVLPLLSAVVRDGRRERLYDQVPTTGGPYRFIEQQLFQERGDLDVVAVGGSYVWAGLDPLVVEQELGRVLRRPAVAINLASNWHGEDFSFHVVRDLLERRKVKMLVLSLSLPYAASPHPHPLARHWITLADVPVLDPRISVIYRLQLIGATLIGAPRQLLSLARPNLRGQDRYDSTHGAGLFRIGFGGAPFEPFRPPPPRLSAPEVLYPGGRAAVRFTGDPLPSNEAYYLARLAELARRHGITTAIVHMPFYFGDGVALADTVEERQDWTQVFGPGSAFVASPPARLFRGFAPPDLTRFFSDTHLNANGAEFFTGAIAPALAAIYDGRARP